MSARDPSVFLEVSCDGYSESWSDFTAAERKGLESGLDHIHILLLLQRADPGHSTAAETQQRPTAAVETHRTEALIRPPPAC